MERYYKSRDRSRSRSPRKRGHSDSNRVGKLPEFIPLVSSSSHAHSSDSDHRSRSSRDRRLSPSEKNKYRALSPTRREDRAPRRNISPLPLDPPIVHHRNQRSSERHPSRSQSPKNSRSSRTNSSERYRSSVFERLGASQRAHSPIRYEENYRRMSPVHLPVENRPLDNGDMNPVRIVVRNDNYQGNADLFNGNRTVTSNDTQAEIIYSIRHLEQKNRDNMKHIHGVRMTVENYQREIFKLEQIVLATSQEIDKLKSRMSFV